MTLDLDTIERAAREATPGPWEVLKRCDNAGPDEACGVTTNHRTKHGHIRGIFQSDAYDECSHPVSLADATHIATSHPAAVLEMVAEIRRLRAGLEEACTLYYTTPEQRAAGFNPEMRLDALRALVKP